jgi:hypothetical protein
VSDTLPRGAAHEPHVYPEEDAMAIKVGDRVPDGTLTEMIDTERPGCTVGPNAFSVGADPRDARWSASRQPPGGVGRDPTARRRDE